MFSVYGKAGRMFRGSMEELRHVGPVAAAARARGVAPIGLDSDDHQFAHSAELPLHALPDRAHREALDSYAQTARVEHPRQPITRVSAIMHSPVITLPEDSTVEHAWQTLSRHQVGQAPVISGDGVLVGLLSRADLMRQERLPGPESHALVWRALLMQSVVDVMWTPVPSVSADTDVRRVAQVLLDTGLPGLPVADEGGQVLGFVSRSDILRAVVADPPLDLWT
jgi:CBS domain-containing protein